VEVGKQAQANSITEEAIKKPFFAMDDRRYPLLYIYIPNGWGTGGHIAAELVYS